MIFIIFDPKFYFKPKGTIFMKKSIFGLGLVLLIISSNAYGEQIPSWIKNNAQWWSQNQITDDEFVKGIQYLIDNKIIQIPDTRKASSGDSHVPAWIKKTAGWWSSNVLNDSDFIKSMQYLVQVGIITVNQNYLTLTSPEFGNNSTIPVEYTCDGKSISPPLVISGVPKNTSSLVLIMDDPDATHGTFVHWTMFNILPNATQFAKGYTSSPQGLNGIKNRGILVHVHHLEIITIFSNCMHLIRISALINYRQSLIWKKP